MANKRFQGPVPPGFSEKKFRETGILVPLIRGPLPKGTTPEQERAFRETGIRVDPTAEREARKREQARQQALAEEQARIRAEIEANRKREEQAKIFKQQARDTEERQQAETRIRQTQEEGGRLERASIQLQERRKELREELKPKTLKQLIKEPRKPVTLKRTPPDIPRVKKAAKLLGATFTGVVIENIIAWRDLPKTAKAIVQNPALLKSIPSAVKGEVVDFGKLVKISPGEAIIKIGTELILLKGTAKAFSSAGKLTGRASARISPKFVGKAKVGKTLQVTTKAGKKVKLKVVGKIGSKSLPRETIRKQVGRAGRRALPVSAQSDELVGFIKRKRIIRKPILNEAKFTKQTKTLLSKFDKGKISKKQLTKLDNLIEKQSGKGILERSFFADPKARIRPSRIGVEKEASIIDILKRDVTFRKQKPQILVFDKVRVEKFPKALKKVKSKLASGKSLTKTEADKLLQFQLKTSGKFKPLGFVSREAEVTLAPGEIVKRGKKIGVTIINKRKVPIFETSVLKPGKKLIKKINQARKGKLTKKQLKSLDKTLKKKTGFNFGLSRPKKSVKRVSIKKIGATTISRIPKRKPRISKIPRRPRKIRRIKRPSRPIRKPSKPSRPSRPSKPSRPGKPRKPSKISRVSRPSRPSKPKIIRRPSKPSRPAILRRPGKPAKVTKLIITKRKKIKKPKARIGYDVFGKRLKGTKKQKKVLIKLNIRPLSKRNALNRGSYAIDHSVARTFKIKRIGKVKKLGKLTKKENKYFKKTRKKYRAFKIRKGVKKPIVRKFIERKGKALIDTRGEKRGLKLHKLARQLKRGSRKRIIKRRPARRTIKSRTSRPRLSVIQLRRLRLNNLKKARAVKRTIKSRTSRPSRPSRSRSPRAKPRTIKRPSRPSRPSRSRKPSPAQLRALAKGRAKLKRMRGQ